MIYVLSGPPRTGKSTLGQRVATRLRLPYLPTDSLRGAIWTLLPATERALQLPIATIRNALDSDHDQFARTTTPTAYVADSHIEATTSWPVIAAVLQYFVGRNESVVAEGTAIRPALVQTWCDERDVSLRACVLTRSKAASAGEDLLHHRTDPDWLVDTIQQPATFQGYGELIVTLGRSLADEAMSVGWPIISVDDDFDQALADAETILCGMPRAAD